MNRNVRHQPRVKSTDLNSEGQGLPCSQFFVHPFSSITSLLNESNEIKEKNW